MSPRCQAATHLRGQNCRRDKPAWVRNRPGTELPWEEMVSAGTVATLAAERAVRPRFRTRRRSQARLDAVVTTSRCSSDAIPAGAGSPSGLHPSVRHGPAQCRNARVWERCADSARRTRATTTPLAGAVVATNSRFLLLG